MTESNVKTQRVLLFFFQSIMNKLVIDYTALVIVLHLFLSGGHVVFADR